MNQDQKRGYGAQVANTEPKATQQEASTEANLIVYRLQLIYRLVLIGVIAALSTTVIVIVMLWLLTGLSVIITLALAISIIGVIGTLIGTVIGHLLGSMHKEQAEQRAEKNLTLLLECLQKSDEPDSPSVP